MMRYRYNILVFLTTLLLYRVSCNNEEPNKDENEYGEARDLNGMDAAQTVSVGEKGLGLDTTTNEIHAEVDQRTSFIKDATNNSMLNLTENNTNGTTGSSNDTSLQDSLKSEPKSKWSCNLLSLFNENEEPKVIVLKNETQLSSILSKSNESQSCFLLYFFAKWCEFCAEFSVEVNAIGRTFYGLPVLAVDAYTFSSVSAKFGITGVPSLILFYDGRPVAKFNRSRTLQGLEEFIHQSTGLSANKSVEIDDSDFDGPLRSKIEEQGDIYLVLSVISIAMIILTNLCLTEKATAIFTTFIDKFKEWAIHEKKD